MMNLTKMNLNRMLYKKLFALVLIHFCVCFLAVSLEADPEEQELERQIMEQQGVASDDISFGMTITGNWGEDTTLEGIYAEMVGSGELLVLVGVFASVYCDEERKSGFLKNLTVGKKRKKYIFLSKVPVIFLFCFVQLLAGLMAMYISSSLSENCSIGSWHNLLCYILTETFLHTAFGLFAMVLYELFRNIVLNILVTVFAAMNLFGFVVSLLETHVSALRMLAEAFGGRFELQQYMLVTRITNMQVNENVFPFVPSMVIALAGLGLYSVLGMVIYSKRDTV